MNYIIEFEAITDLNIDPDYECVVSREDLGKYIKHWDSVNDASRPDYTATNISVNARLNEQGNIVWTCQECQGKGRVDRREECGMPASECCGGCTVECECPTCIGQGEIVFEKDNLG